MSLARTKLGFGRIERPDAQRCLTEHDMDLDISSRPLTVLFWVPRSARRSEFATAPVKTPPGKSALPLRVIAHEAGRNRCL